MKIHIDQAWYEYGKPETVCSLLMSMRVIHREHFSLVPALLPYFTRKVSSLSVWSLTYLVSFETASLSPCLEGGKCLPDIPLLISLFSRLLNDHKAISLAFSVRSFVFVLPSGLQDCLRPCQEGENCVSHLSLSHIYAHFHACSTFFSLNSMLYSSPPALPTSQRHLSWVCSLACPWRWKMSGSPCFRHTGRDRFANVCPSLSWTWLILTFFEKFWSIKPWAFDFIFRLFCHFWPTLCSWWGIGREKIVDKSVYVGYNDSQKLFAKCYAPYYCAQESCADCDRNWIHLFTEYLVFRCESDEISDDAPHVHHRAGRKPITTRKLWNFFRLWNPLDRCSIHFDLAEIFHQRGMQPGKSDSLLGRRLAIVADLNRRRGLRFVIYRSHRIPMQCMHRRNCVLAGLKWEAYADCWLFSLNHTRD